MLVCQTCLMAKVDRKIIYIYVHVYTKLYSLKSIIVLFSQSTSSSLTVNCKHGLRMK